MELEIKANVLLCKAWIFFIILAAIDKACSTEAEENAVKKAVVIDLPRVTKCYQCYKSTHGESCLTMYNTSSLGTVQCKNEEHYCQVSRLYTGGNLTTFERGCGVNCKPGCKEVMGLERCFTCCNSTSLCNRDYFPVSGANQTTRTLIFITAVTGLSPLLTLILRNIPRN
ncbi:unnamed protein product [Owenia fusiformis]|uniref:Uncharacterized protein n=1 Tax=Owenia fusiformis TaxID=6347 RepID=A0A8J1U7R7_OWEFU|nr:unnamed protein product [Owenia fusiformis]